MKKIQTCFKKVHIYALKLNPSCGPDSVCDFQVEDRLQCAEKYVVLCIVSHRHVATIISQLIPGGDKLYNIH